MTTVSRRRVLTGFAAALVVAPLLAACGSSSDDGSGNGAAAAADPGSAKLQTVSIGVVPSLSLGFLEVGEAQGFFADQGLKLNITPVDSGPTVITGLVSGQYDLGYTAYAPPLLAVSQGQDLRLVEHLDNVSPKDNGGVVVKKGGPITSWKDLVGKKIGVNAPRSLGVLEIQGSIAKDGGDASTPDKLQLIPLPFNQIADQVESGAIDAGFLLEPFLTSAEKKSDLTNLGDPALTFLPATTPTGGIFTSEKTETDKADLIKKFQTAFEESAQYGNAHLDEVRAAGAKLSGLSDADAKLLPLDPVETTTPAKADFEPLLKALVDYGWTPKPVNIDQFLGQ